VLEMNCNHYWIDGSKVFPNFLAGYFDVCIKCGAIRVKPLILRRCMADATE